jgi:hypothetical protein
VDDDAGQNLTEKAIADLVGILRDRRKTEVRGLTWYQKILIARGYDPVHAERLREAHAASLAGVEPAEEPTEPTSEPAAEDESADAQFHGE